MIWTVTYRSADGHLTHESMEADSRVALLHELKKLNLSAIKITEGERSQSKKKQPPSLFIIICALAISFLLVLALLNFKQQNQNHRSIPSPPKTIKKQNIRPRNISSTAKQAHPKQVAQISITNNTAEKVDVRRVLVSIVTNETGIIVSRYRKPDGKMVRVIDRIRPKVAQTATDQLLAMITATQSGGPPVPIRPGDKSLDEAFIKSLEKPIEIGDGDSEFTLMLKERLAQTREAMAQAMIETKISFAEIILEEQKMQKENSKLLHDCQEAINECLKANDNEGAAQIYHRFAPEFENLGLSGLTLDPEIDNNNN